MTRGDLEEIARVKMVLCRDQFGGRQAVEGTATLRNHCGRWCSLLCVFLVRRLLKKCGKISFV